MGGYGEIKVACLCLVVISAMVAAAPHAEAVISCDQVLNSVSACLGYLQRGGAVTPPCCDGLKSLTKAAAATPDLQAVCSCTKSLQPRVGAKTEFINSLHVQCGSKFPYKYSPSMDCSKVKW